MLIKYSVTLDIGQTHISKSTMHPGDVEHFLLQSNLCYTQQGKHVFVGILFPPFFSLKFLYQGYFLNWRQQKISQKIPELELIYITGTRSSLVSFRGIISVFTVYFILYFTKRFRQLNFKFALTVFGNTILAINK